MALHGSEAGHEESPAAKRPVRLLWRLGWFVLYWMAGVLAVGTVAFLIRLMITR